MLDTDSHAQMHCDGLPGWISRKAIDEVNDRRGRIVVEAHIQRSVVDSFVCAEAISMFGNPSLYALTRKQIFQIHFLLFFQAVDH